MQQENFVINIGRQKGSGGKAVGEALARRLGGIRVYDKQLINLAAEESGLCPEFFERVDERKSHSFLSTLLGYLRTPFVGDDCRMSDVLSGESLFQIQSDVIRDIASRESCIFVGRCADYILRDHPRTLNVFVTAARADRRARLCSQFGLTEDEAEALMTRTDDRRASYYNYYSCGRWGVASTYDLCLDSSSVGIEGAADFILEFAARKWNMDLNGK